MPDAAYYRAWRLAHPEYRAREAERSRRRKAELGRGDRAAEYANTAAREAELRRMKNGDNGWLEESELILRARAIASDRLKPDRRTVLWDDRHEDLVGEVVLALVEGRDPYDAMMEWLRKDWSHRYRRAPLLLL